MPVSLASTSASSMHGALVPIAYATSTGSTQTFTFSSIPQTYQDLFMVIYSKSTTSNRDIIAYINNDTSSGLYSDTELYGNGSTAGSNRAANQTNPYLTRGTNNYTANFGTFQVHYLNYANTNTYKNYLWRFANDQNGSGDVGLCLGSWRNTSGISRLDITNTTYPFASGTTVELFAIRTVGQ